MTGGERYVLLSICRFFSVVVKSARVFSIIQQKKPGFSEKTWFLNPAVEPGSDDPWQANEEQP